MKISIDRAVVAKAVAWVARTLPSRPNLPILAGMQLSAQGDSLMIAGFDGDTCAKAVVPADVTEEGEVLVSGKLLADIIASFTDQRVNFDTDGTSVEVSSGQADFLLQTLPLNEYPQLPQVPPTSGTVNGRAFAEAISQVAVAAGREQPLPVFTGIKIEIKDDVLSFMATDRYRMALKEMTWTPAATSYEGSALVPAKVLSEVSRSMSDSETIVLALADAEFGDQIMGFEGSDGDIQYHLITRLLDGEFPKVRHVMDVEGDLVVRMKVDELVPAVKRIALVAERNTPVSMNFRDNLVTLQGGTQNQASGSDAVNALIEQVNGEVDFDAVGFKAEYLTSALAILGTPYVSFAFNGPAKPCLLMGLNEIDGEPISSYKHVIMLMRLRG